MNIKLATINTQATTMRTLVKYALVISLAASMWAAPIASKAQVSSNYPATSCQDIDDDGDIQEAWNGMLNIGSTATFVTCPIERVLADNVAIAQAIVYFNFAVPGQICYLVRSDNFGNIVALSFNFINSSGQVSLTGPSALPGPHLLTEHISIFCQLYPNQLMTGFIYSDA